MDWVYRGLYLIGDKKTGRITNVQVEDNIRGRQHSLPFAVYLARGVEPDHRTLSVAGRHQRNASPSGKRLIAQARIRVRQRALPPLLAGLGKTQIHSR